jgi:hypothetical protein
MRPTARESLRLLALPMVLMPFGLVGWLVGLLVGMHLGDEWPALGFGVVVCAWALPTSVRLLSLVPHGRWILLVAGLSVPAGVVGGLASMFTMVFWDAGLLSGPPPTDHAFRAMTLGYLVMAAPVVIGQAAVEAFGAGLATRWRTGAGSIAVSMGCSWLFASTAVVAGFAWDVQADAPWAPWVGCAIGVGAVFVGPLPGAVIGRSLGVLFAPGLETARSAAEARLPG